MYRVLIFICICMALTFADTVWNLNQKGLKAYKKGEYNTALDYFEKALKESPHNRQLTYNKGLALYKLNRIAEAKKAFDLVSFEQSDSLTSEVYYHRGLVSQKIADSLLSELQEKGQNQGLEGLDPSQLQGDPQMMQKMLQQQRIQQKGGPGQEKPLTADSVKSVYEDALRNYTLALDKNSGHRGALKNRELSARSLALVPDEEKQENPDQQNKDDQKQDDQNKDQKQDQQNKDDQKQDQENKDDQQQDENKDQQDQENKDDQQQDENKDQQDQENKDQDKNKDDQQQDENKDQQDQENKEQEDQNKQDQENKEQQPQPQPQEQDSLDREQQEALQMLMQFADDADDLNKPQVDIGPAVPQNGKDW